LCELAYLRCNDLSDKFRSYSHIANRAYLTLSGFYYFARTLSAADTFEVSFDGVKAAVQLTVQARVVGLDMGILDNAIFNDQGVPLGTIASKNSSPVKRQIKSLCEAQIRICKEADLFDVSFTWHGFLECMLGIVAFHQHTPLEPEGSRVLPHAFMLFGG